MSLKKVRFLQQFKNRQSACIISELQLWYLKYLPEKKTSRLDLSSIFLLYLSSQSVFHRLHFSQVSDGGKGALILSQ